MAGVTLTKIVRKQHGTNKGDELKPRDTRIAFQWDANAGVAADLKGRGSEQQQRHQRRLRRPRNALRDASSSPRALVGSTTAQDTGLLHVPSAARDRAAGWERRPLH